ncbi:MAG: glycosyltransferase family 4 protein [Candidatus Levybacteria bacterium]|nr:glycosyltransferase family 4 protein [Candidatus Levybacteria bacterium]
MKRKSTLKKIVFLTRSYYPNIGGVEKHIYEVCKNLDGKKYAILIITESLTIKKKSEIEFYHLPHVQVVRIPIKKRNWFLKFHIWKWMWDHRSLFRDADVIHCHDVFFWYVHLACLYPLKNVYTTFHGYEGYPISLKAVIYRKVFEYMSNRTICVGDFMKKWYHAKPTLVIYGGVNEKKIVKKFKKNSAVFIGRLDEHTGILEYAHAVNIIRKKIPKFTLTIYGEGKYKNKLEGDGIIVKDSNIFADDIISQYEYAFVSRYLSILESLASQRSVYAIYDNPLKKDYLALSVFSKHISIVKNPEEIAYKILHDDKSQKKSLSGYLLSKKLTWKKVAKDYENLWGFN